jgi:hypothetical protein
LPGTAVDAYAAAIMRRPIPFWSRLAGHALALAVVASLAAGCVSKPTTKLNRAEISGLRIAFPPSIGLLMTVYIDVYNPNSYDIAVRAVRGQVLLAGRHALPVEFQAPGDGVWLGAEATTSVAVPVTVPGTVALAVLQESTSAASIPYRFTGRADVTASRTFQIEKDDYSVDAEGAVSREQIDRALRLGL